MELIEQLSKFEYYLREKVDRVLDSDASSLEQLKEQLCYFRSAEDVTFSTEDSHLYVHYTYRGYWDEDETKSVQLPDLFVTDFEEFMRQAQ
jgi:hypothetical protein